MANGASVPGPGDESGVWEGSWQEAMQVNHGDYAYHSSGGMISHEQDDTYTIRNGDLPAACAGNWTDVERTGVLEEGIPGALEELKMPPTGWSYE